MDNIFVKNPIVLFVHGIEDPWTTFVSQQITFGVSENKNSNKHSKNHSKKHGGDIVGEDFSEFDIINVEDSISRPLLKEDKDSTITPVKEPKETKEPIDVVKVGDVKEIPKRENVVKIKTIKRLTSNICVYPEDSVAELKQKIQLATGIEQYKQHLFVESNGPVPLYYTVGDLNINIMEQPDENIEGVPVNNAWYHDEMIIAAGDPFITMEQIYMTYGTSHIHLFNIDDYFGGVGSLSDTYQFEMIYYSFVRIYWPMMSIEVFKDYLDGVHGKKVRSNYPLLCSVSAKVIEAERELLNYKYELLADASRGYRSHPEFKKYNPEFVIQKFGSIKGSVINSSISSATLVVDKPTMIAKNNRAQINLRNLFDEMTTSTSCPIIRLVLGDMEPSYTKLMSVVTNRNIQEIYEKVKHQIVSTDASIIFVINLKRTIVLKVMKYGTYHIIIHWKDEDHVNFRDTFAAALEVNPLISIINGLGRLVFESHNRLSLLSEANSEFSMLNISIFWKQTLDKSHFTKLRERIDADTSSHIVKKRMGSEPDTIAFYISKGIVEHDIAQIENSFTSNNRYSYLFDSATKQRFDQLFGDGRSVTITHRSTDVRIDVSGIREKEFDYFYNYITTMLYSLEGLERSDSGSGKKAIIVSTDDIMMRLKNKNRLKTLKSKDPDGFNMKQFDSDIVYSRICQKTHQPIPFSEDEIERLPDKFKNQLVKYWNFTTQEPMYYVCPNPTFPYLTFISGHPKGYCLPCCKKNPPYRFEIGEGAGAGINDLSKREKAYFKCLEAPHCMEEEEVEESGSRYIMNYGKELDLGRIGRLPDILEKYLKYNLVDKQILSECYDLQDTCSGSH
jgi:hypothetical protein